MQAAVRRTARRDCLRRCGLVLTVALSACRPVGHVASSTAPLAPPRSKGTVVVAIVVDQMAAWIADERWPLLPADGGFGRLLREGTYARDVRYAHAATDTAPGHASLFTGAIPRVSGVWANDVFDVTTDAKVSIFRDATTTLVTAGKTSAVGASAQRLAIDTVADRFRAARPDAPTVALSLKDRAAICGGGRKPTASLWFDRALDRFVTSSAFARELPAWAVGLARPDAVRAEPWTLLDAAWVASHAATPDDQPGEGALEGMTITFPHDVAHAKEPASALRASPFGDDALLALAVAAIDAHRDADGPRFLAVSLSANDYVGHTYGPDSWEAWDELRRLDASLARFFAALDTRFGPEGWSVILAGDHGTTTMPEAAAIPAARPWCNTPAPDRWERACGPVGRLMPDAIARELRVAASRALGRSDLVEGLIDPYVYLSEAGRALPPVERARLMLALTKVLLAHPEVDRVFETRAFPEECPAEDDESVEALVCRAVVRDRSGELYILPRRGSFFDADVVVGKGTSHGSPYLFDRSVPVVVRAPARAAAGRVIDRALSFRTFARTLSTLLDVDPPDRVSARTTDLVRAEHE